MKLEDIKKQKFSKKEQREFDRQTLVGDLIGDIRIGLGFTQEKLAKKCGMKQPAIARIESYSQLPSLTTLFNIADKCGYRLKISIEKK